MSAMRGSPLFLAALGALLLAANAPADETGAQARFERVKDEPTLLREFLYAFPKGGDLHNHVAGAVYAETYLRWAAEDGKCIDLDSYMVTMPPCDGAAGRPAMAEVRYDGDIANHIIDAFSVRNYERRPVSGHDQFFATFRRFSLAGRGREGDILAVAAARAARQNILYLELMQSRGMAAARELAAAAPQAFATELPLARRTRHPDIQQLAADTMKRLDRIEERKRAALSCGKEGADPGCGVPIRYLAQVIRVFPREQVLAQTLLAFHLIEKDPRYVGLNFVAPEDHPVTLRDYRWQMAMIGELAKRFPAAKDAITLHAGELVLGLVPPEHLGWHIRAALDLAGARRIGHGIDIVHDPQAGALMRRMAEQGVLVEINLTSNEVILGVSGDRHPFRAYRKHGVPMAFSTDDEGVARIDLTHEYQRAVETYDLSYADLKHFSRNALAYSFLAGAGLLASTRSGEFAAPCAGAHPARAAPGRACRDFLAKSEKAALQWELERRFRAFEKARE